eukprot:4780662-Pleurochrysis_carterae.AAC.1
MPMRAPGCACASAGQAKRVNERARPNASNLACASANAPICNARNARRCALAHAGAHRRLQLTRACVHSLKESNTRVTGVGHSPQRMQALKVSGV